MLVGLNWNSNVLSCDRRSYHIIYRIISYHDSSQCSGIDAKGERTYETILILKNLRWTCNMAGQDDDIFRSAESKLTKCWILRQISTRLTFFWEHLEVRFTSPAVHSSPQQSPAVPSSNASSSPWLTSPEEAGGPKDPQTSPDEGWSGFQWIPMASRVL